MKILLVLLSSVLTLISANVYSSPDENQYGYKVATTLHEVAKYNQAEFYRKEFPKRYIGVATIGEYSAIEKKLREAIGDLGDARYENLDKPLKTYAEELVVKLLDEAGVDVKSHSANTYGDLSIAFNPGKNSTLDFKVSGINIQAKASGKYKHLVSVKVDANVSKLTIQGNYDYYNGVIIVNSIDAPLDVDADTSISGLLGSLIDPFDFIGSLINYGVDHLILSELPGNLSELFEGNSISASVFGVKDFIEIGRYVFNGVDYGKVLLETLDEHHGINDNFSLVIGSGSSSQGGGRIELTIGNVSVEINADSVEEVCRLSIDPDCDTRY